MTRRTERRVIPIPNREKTDARGWTRSRRVSATTPARLYRAGTKGLEEKRQITKSRLLGVRSRGESPVRIEAMLEKRENDHSWWARLKPAVSVDVGARLRFGDSSENVACLLGFLDAAVIEVHGGRALPWPFSSQDPRSTTPWRGSAKARREPPITATGRSSIQIYSQRASLLAAASAVRSPARL